MIETIFILKLEVFLISVILENEVEEWLQAKNIPIREVLLSLKQDLTKEVIVEVSILGEAN